MTESLRRNPDVAAGSTDTRTQEEGPAAAPPPPPPAPADRYRLEAEIARGGMGVVYRATDRALDREVAVKVLAARYAPGSETALRFAAEARITAQLQHPGIPPVHDRGVLPDGRPFLAMKLIKGRTLDTLLRQRPDPAADRGRLLAVFEQVCQAVAYAHAHRVIHRDLKPSNVMVGGFGEVQVMDWGLAKVLTEAAPAAAGDPEATSAGTVICGRGPEGPDAAATRTGSVLGTPAYMPPEQAAGEVARLDERADVFGLGAILAVLLTGQPPYAGPDREAVRVMAVRGDLAACRARLKRCGAEPGLVALCKRCLAFAPADRPADAGEVAKAVAELRAAADERARRAELDRVKSEGEKTAALLQAAEQRKRRRVQAALGLTFTATVVLVGVGLWWADRRQARVEAERAADRAAAVARARQAVHAAAVLADDLRAHFRYDDALRALDQAAGLIPPGAPAEIRAVLEEARADTVLLRDLDEIRFQRVRADPRAGQLGLSAAYRKAFAARGHDPSEPDPAAAEWVARSPLRLALSVALTDWCSYGTGPVARDRLLAVARRADPGEWGDRLRDPNNWGPGAALRLAARAPVADLPPHLLVILLQKVNRGWPGAREALAAAAARHRSDFWVQFEVGYFFTFKDRDPRRAVGPFRAALALRPDCAYALNLLGDSLQSGGDPDGALQEYREALRIDPDNPHTHLSIGHILQGKGDVPGALAAYRRALAVTRKLAGPHPAAPRHLGDLAGGHQRIGWLLEQSGSLAQALEAYRQALPVRRRLAEANPAGEVEAYRRALADVERLIDADPAFARHRGELARGHFDRGRLLERARKPAEALEAYREALAHYRKLADGTPAETSYQSAVAATHFRIGVVLKVTGKPAEAVESYKQALALLRTLADADPAAPRYSSELAWTYHNLGWALEALERREEGLAAHRQALSIRQRLVAAHPTEEQYRIALAISHEAIGWLLLGAGRPAEAAESFRTAAAAFASLVEGPPNILRSRVDQARNCNHLGRALAEAGRPGEAVAAHREALAALKGPVASSNNLADKRELGVSHTLLGRALAQAGRPGEAAEAYREGLAVLQKLADARPTVPDYRAALAQGHHDLGRLHAAQGRFAEAFAELDAGLAIRQKLADDPRTPSYTTDLGDSHASRGWARARAGQPAAAAEDLRRAIRLWAGNRAPTLRARFERARALALLAGLGADRKSGVTVAEAAAFADGAVAALRDAAAAGWAQIHELKAPDFDALCSRDDFRKLTRELEARAAGGRP